MSIAALIYCSACFRGLRFNFRVVGKTVIRLKGVLEQGIVEDIYVSKQFETLFWILVVGGVAAEGKFERKWFGANLSRIFDISYANARSWEIAKSALERAAWLSELDSFGIRLWGEALG